MLLLLDLLCLLFLAVITILYGLTVTLPLLLIHPLLGMRLDDAVRWHNKLYGTLVIYSFRPLVRVQRRGLENIPAEGPCVIIANHRSFADIFFFGLIPIPRVTVVARSWPFRIPVFGWFMRLAKYIDIERQPMSDLLDKRGHDLIARGVSFLFFPEGHRSRDGRLRRFQSGAFLLAAQHGLPLAPICLSGTEQLTAGGRARGFAFLQPAQVTMELLPAIYPADFAGDKQAVKLKHAAEEAFRKYYGE